MAKRDISDRIQLDIGRRTLVDERLSPLCEKAREFATALCFALCDVEDQREALWHSAMLGSRSKYKA